MPGIGLMGRSILCRGYSNRWHERRLDRPPQRTDDDDPEAAGGRYLDAYLQEFAKVTRLSRATIELHKLTQVSCTVRGTVLYWGVDLLQILGANQNIGGNRVVITDESISVSQLLGVHVPGLPLQRLRL